MAPETTSRQHSLVIALRSISGLCPEIRRATAQGGD
jgi:hypothetical protein